MVVLSLCDFVPSPCVRNSFQLVDLDRSSGSLPHCVQTRRRFCSWHPAAQVPAAKMQPGVLYMWPGPQPTQQATATVHHCFVRVKSCDNRKSLACSRARTPSEVTLQDRLIRCSEWKFIMMRAVGLVRLRAVLLRRGECPFDCGGQVRMRGGASMGLSRRILLKACAP